MTVADGTRAPDFRLQDQHGQSLGVSSFRGEHAVVLMFYPYAFSGVCTGELAAVRDHLPDLRAAGAALLAVSCDPMFALRAFADRDGLEFPLLSDFWPHGAVAEQYGVFDAKRGCARRSTYIIDRDGVVRWQVHHALPDPRDLGEQLTVLGRLTA